MLLAIDVGNTNTVFAVFNKGSLVHSWRCRTMGARTIDEYASFLGPLFYARDIDLNSIGDVIVSSVVPETERNLYIFCEQYLKCVPRFITHADIPVQIELDRPEELGADRLVNALAVIEHYGAPAIVLDFGTATTFDVIDQNAIYRGGVIAPGINLSISALSQAASKLPKVSIQKPKAAIGTNTTDAMRSGVYWGYVGLIREVLKQINAEIEGTPCVVATGGLSSLFENDLPEIEHLDPNLNIKGLQKLYELKRNKE